jgi:hypothetical protein
MSRLVGTDRWSAWKQGKGSNKQARDLKRREEEKEIGKRKNQSGDEEEREVEEGKKLSAI